MSFALVRVKGAIPLCTVGRSDLNLRLSTLRVRLFRRNLPTTSLNSSSLDAFESSAKHESRWRGRVVARLLAVTSVVTHGKRAVGSAGSGISGELRFQPSDFFVR